MSAGGAGDRAVGIDIGGTKIAVATVSAADGIVREATIPTDSERGIASGVSRIAETLRRLLDQSGWRARDLQGIGIGCAGPVDRARGTILNPHTLPGWEDGDIVTPLREAFGCPVRLENDADMAVLGECHAGAGRGFDPVVMLTIGTAAARGLGDARRLFARAREREPAAEGILRDALSAMARGTWTIAHTLLPERLILGGGLMDEHYEVFAAAAEDAIARAVVVPRERMSVARASLGNRAGVLGAARAVMSP